jgi:L-threonylcarbamoyladenylate synthase
MHEDIKKAKQTLEQGGIICCPTDTIWGLSCDATNKDAVEKLFKIKNRNSSKSMLILVDDIGKVPSYIKEMPDIAYDLLEASEKPLTLILPDAKNLAANLVAEDGTIGIRVVENHPWLTKLLKQFKKPIASTSANFSGETSVQFFNEIDEELLKKVDYVVEYGRDNDLPTEASSIIKLGAGGEIEIIRH